MTLTSTDFSSTGFTHTNVPLSATLQFSTPLVNSTSSWLEHKVNITHKTPPDAYGPGFVKAVLAGHWGEGQGQSRAGPGPSCPEAFVCRCGLRGCHCDASQTRPTPAGEPGPLPP